MLAINSAQEDETDESGSARNIGDNFMLKQPSHQRLRGLKDIEESNSVNMPPPGMGLKLIERAKEALYSYAQEPTPLARDHDEDA